MLPETIVFAGIVMCFVSIFAAIVTIVAQCIVKKRLNRKLDMEYGKRRH